MRAVLPPALTSFPRSLSSCFASSPIHSHGFGPVKDHCAHLLDLCILSKKAPQGAQVHSKIVVTGLQHDSFLCTKLITLYSTCGRLQDAVSVFHRASPCNAFVLNSMIRGYNANELYREAIDLFHRKTKEGLQPDSYTFSCVLKACASLSDFCQGRELHRIAAERGFDSDVFVGNSLMCMYAKCGSMEHVVQVFDGMSQQDTVSWTSIISGYALNGYHTEAADKVREMIECGFRPDHVTILAVLSMTDVPEVIGEVHGYILRTGLELVFLLHVF